MSLALHLALADLRHDWRGALCFMAALTGVLAPLLILFALKSGTIDRLVETLFDNPANRQIIAPASAATALSAADFERIAAWPGVGFVVPATRQINASADTVRAAGGRRLARDVSLIPTAPGDPLLASAGPGVGEAALSAALAARLRVAEGDAVEIFIGRRIGGVGETASASLLVAAVLDETVLGIEAALVPLPFLLAVERFRDDAATTTADWLRPAPPPERFAAFRLYADRLDGLQAVIDRLEREEGIAARPLARNAALLVEFQAGLQRLFILIAALGLVGFWAALAANLRGLAERRRTSYSALRLLGAPARLRLALPLIQSLLLVAAGLVVTAAVVLPVILLINASAPGDAAGNAARLSPASIGATVVLLAAAAVTASGWAMATVARIPPDEVLRHA